MDSSVFVPYKIKLYKSLNSQHFNDSHDAHIIVELKRAVLISMVRTGKDLMASPLSARICGICINVIQNKLPVFIAIIYMSKIFSSYYKKWPQLIIKKFF